MAPVIVVGVDPGLVHTGVVFMEFHRASRQVYVDSKVVDGPDAKAVKMFMGMHTNVHVFIEGYRPRHHYGTDERMVHAVREFQQELKGSKVLQNTGVKKVIRRPLMQALGTWTFSTRSHHQDLRSAARIALLGMVKDDELNELLSDFVRDLVDGRPWDVLQ